MEKPPVTEKTIEHLCEFIDATLNEFWSVHPGLKEKWHHLLGSRIHQVQNDGMDEQRYINQWKDKV